MYELEVDRFTKSGSMGDAHRRIGQDQSRHQHTDSKRWQACNLNCQDQHWCDDQIARSTSGLPGKLKVPQVPGSEGWVAVPNQIFYPMSPLLVSNQPCRSRGCPCGSSPPSQIDRQRDLASGIGYSPAERKLSRRPAMYLRVDSMQGGIVRI